MPITTGNGNILGGYAGNTSSSGVTPTPVGLPRPPNAGLVPGVNSPLYTYNGSVAVPTSSGGVVDPSGSSNHLTSSYFTGGSSAQWMPTGGMGFGTPGTPTQTGCSICDWVSANFLWVVAVVVLLVVVVLYV